MSVTMVTESIMMESHAQVSFYFLLFLSKVKVRIVAKGKPDLGHWVISVLGPFILLKNKVIELYGMILKWVP